MLMENSTYIHSHTAPNKGIEYDTYYTESGWLQYIWSREQEVLFEIISRFFQNRSVHLLDFACGTGRILSALENRVASAVGVDVSESMLAVARPKLKRSTLVLKNIVVDNPFPSEQFDLITAFRFFVNAEPELRHKVMSALVPLMKKDGYLIFNNHHNYYSLRRAYQRFYANLRQRPCTKNFQMMSECRDLAKTHGLEIVAIYSIGILNIPVITLPKLFYRLCDRIANRYSTLACFSESPIIVCRRG